MTKVMVTVCIVMFVGILLLPRRAVAFNRAQLGQLKATQKCQDCDLTGAELSFANLFDANLTGQTWPTQILPRHSLPAQSFSRQPGLTGVNANQDLSGSALNDWFRKEEGMKILPVSREVTSNALAGKTNLELLSTQSRNVLFLAK